MSGVRKNESVRRFRAMNTDIEAVVVTGETKAAAASDALQRVEMLFHHCEATLSRFIPDSELCALNAADGRPFIASPTLFAAVSAAITAAQVTGGLFDPTILNDLIAAGYDRSFELVPVDQAGASPLPARRHCWTDVELDTCSRAIRMPAGCALDLGGIGKGWTVDRAGALLDHFGNYAIDAGGDMRFGGAQADGSAWAVGVQDPLTPSRDLAQLDCHPPDGCAVATSTTARRRWLRSGRPQHHLIDPRSGVPSQSGVVSATVIAQQVARAETLAKAALILGPSAGIHFLDSQPDAEGLIVLDGGFIQRSRGLRELSCVA